MATRKQYSDVGYSLGQGPLSSLYPLPIIATRVPSTSDQAQIGTIWINKTSGSQATWILASVINNVATWVASGTSSGTFVGGITVGTSEQFTNLGAGGMVTNSTGVVSSLSMANGALIIGNGAGNQPVAANLTAGAGITITNGAGTITIAATSVINAWQTKAANFNAAVDVGYVITAGSGTVTATLPTVAAVGDEITVIYSSVGAADIMVVTATASKLFTSAGAATTLTWPACDSLNGAVPSVTVVCTVASATVPTWVVTDMVGDPLPS